MNQKNEKILFEKDWDFELTEVDGGRLILIVYYSPKSYVDSLIKMELNPAEAKAALLGVDSCSRLAGDIRTNMKQYEGRFL